ncbi:MAG: hypothetical protein AAF821_12185 [Cyanobacteria bacterium P01_D01_bin.156]
MQHQLIQKFIQLPNIVGFSLIPLGQTISSDDIYSVGFKDGNCPKQHPLLVQGIQQILHTTPDSLEHCNFHFGDEHHIDLHKVENQAILLVVSKGQTSHEYLKAISELIHFIKADYTTLVESINATNADESSEDISAVTHTLLTTRLDDLLEAMNSISQITSRYLGARLVADHWRNTQLEDLIWMQQFQISADGTLSISGRLPELTPEQLTAIRLWTKRFHQRCHRFIRDYDTLVEQSLPRHHWQLLFGE